MVKGNICDSDLMDYILKKNDISHVIHFAAQSHVQNSFNDSKQYTKDNIVGTHTLLECCRLYGKIEKFLHVSTDEVYGESMLDINEKQKTENSILCPSNPYAATKSAAELIAQAYYHSFKMPIVITRGNNVYGPNQYPEKLIPKFIELLNNDKKVTIQGDGSNVRAFLHVDDTISAFICILEKGVVGEIYNIGCDEGMEYSVLDIAKMLIKLIKNTDNYDEWIEYIEDRPFNDKRYYISNEKVKELGWNINVNFENGIKDIVHYNKLNPDVFFFHIEKCGGMSLRQILYEYFMNIYDVDKISMLDQNIISHNYNDFFLYNNLKCILCHSNYNTQIKSIRNNSCFTISCIRDPIERLISHYYYFYYETIGLKLYELDNDKLQKMIHNLGNVMIWRLSNGTYDLNNAYKNIDKINFIIRLENFNEDIQKLNKCLNDKYNVKYEIKSLHVNKLDTVIDKINKELDIIAIEPYKHLMLDLKIYDYIIQMKNK